MTENSFVKSLLGFQQDGKDAISAPSNWTEAPLLEVQTKIDDEIEEFVSQLTKPENRGDIAPWLFLVGSPGNGKSAAVGKIVRELKKQDYQILTEAEVDIESLSASDIPYKVFVRRPGEAYAIAWFAQDASVVPDPYLESSNPARELINLVSEAWQKGVALVVCTNRGVIENAYRMVLLDKTLQKNDWSKLLREVVEENPATGERELHGLKNQPFEKVKLTYHALDKSSLIFESDSLSQLLQNIVKEENWEPCGVCDVNKVCPFHSNAISFRNPECVESVINLIRNAELLSGQTIVFREALGLLSFIFSGCPLDFNDESPCGWVRRVNNNGNIFALIARRYYMGLFSAYSPMGFEVEKSVKNHQLRYLSELVKDIEDSEAKTALDKAIAYDKIISREVGTERLIGRNGIFRKLDPLCSNLPEKYFDDWENIANLDNLLSDKLFGDLEKEVISIWKTMIESVEAANVNTVEKYRWLMRMITAISFRMGAIQENRCSFSMELDSLLGVLELVEREEGSSAIPQKKNIEKELDSILSQSTAYIPISPNVSISGDIRNKLKPRIDSGEIKKNKQLAVRFGDMQSIFVDTEAYVWLKKKTEEKISRYTFPTQVLEIAKEALVNAAIISGYHIQNDGIELKIELPAGRGSVFLKRDDGVVYVE